MPLPLISSRKNLEGSALFAPSNAHSSQEVRRPGHHYASSISPLPSFLSQSKHLLASWGASNITPLLSLSTERSNPVATLLTVAGGGAPIYGPATSC